MSLRVWRFWLWSTNANRDTLRPAYLSHFFLFGNGAAAADIFLLQIFIVTERLSCLFLVNRWKYYQHRIEIDVTLNMADFTFSHQQRGGSPTAQPVRLQGCNTAIRTKRKISKFICVDIDVDWTCEAFQWLFISGLWKELELGWRGVWLLFIYHFFSLISSIRNCCE